MKTILSWSSIASGTGSGFMLSINGKSIVFSKSTEISCGSEVSIPSEAVTENDTNPLSFSFGIIDKTLSEIL